MKSPHIFFILSLSYQLPAQPTMAQSIPFTESGSRFILKQGRQHHAAGPETNIT